MTKLARFSFNCRDPIPKNVKSSCSPRHKNRGLEGLTKSNLLTEFDGRNPQTVRFKRDGRGTSPKHESGKPFSDRESFTKSYRLDFHSGKTVDQPIPTGKAEDSRRSASTGREPSRRRGVAIFFLATRERFLWMAACYGLAFVDRFNPFVLSLIFRCLSRRSSIRRLDEIRFAPIDRRIRCETSTASSMVPIFSASSTLDIGVTSRVNPGISDIARTAALTYCPTLVPAPMGWMLNSAIRTIRLAFGCTDN